MTIDKAALVAREEHHGPRLLHRLPEPPHREVNLPPQPLLLVIPQPILQQRRIQRRRAQRVEPEPLPRMHDGQLPRHGQHSPLASRIRKLRGRGPDEGDDAGGVDDGAARLRVPAQGEDGVLAAEPDALYVYGVGEVPDGLRGGDGVGVVGVHYAGIVEHYVEAAPGVEGLDEGGDAGLFGDIADLVQG